MGSTAQNGNEASGVCKLTIDNLIKSISERQRSTAIICEPDLPHNINSESISHSEEQRYVVDSDSSHQVFVKVEVGECSNTENLLTKINSVQDDDVKTTEQSESESSKASTAVMKTEESLFSSKSYVCSQCYIVRCKSQKELNEHLIKFHADQLHTCQICEKVYTCKKSLQQHVRRRHTDPRFSCPECNKSFRMKCSLNQHLLSHSRSPKQKKFQCSICDKQFLRENKLKIHEETHNVKQSSESRAHLFLCDVCGGSFKSKSGLEQHRRIHKKDRNFVPRKHICHMCGKIFSKKSLLDGHLRVHLGERSLKCGICAKGFFSKEALRQHEKTHGEPSFGCHLCTKKFTRNSHLREHLKRHEERREGKVFRCSICKISFPTLGDCVNHRKGHAIEVKTDSGEMSQSRNFVVPGFPCEVCGKHLSSKVTLAQHALLHTGQRPFKCKTCDKSFLIKWQLSEHERIHDQDAEAFVCDICGKRTTRKILMDFHVRTHLSATPYQCETCGRSFKSATIRNQHRFVHRVDTPYGCSTCGKRFRRKKYLDTHQLTHTGIKAHVCDKCGSKFSQRGDMMRHMRKKHPEETQ